MKQSCQGICSGAETADIGVVLKVARLECLISSATICTSTAMSLLVCDLAHRNFGNSVVSVAGMEAASPATSSRAATTSEYPVIQTLPSEWQYTTRSTVCRSSIGLGIGKSCGVKTLSRATGLHTPTWPNSAPGRRPDPVPQPYSPQNWRRSGVLPASKRRGTSGASGR